MTRRDVRAESPASPTSRGAAVFVGLASALTLGGVRLAVARPAWLVSPLQATVKSGGALASVVYVLLRALAAPLHLGGVLVALSVTVFGLWQAAALSFVGLLGHSSIETTCVYAQWSDQALDDALAGW